MPEGTQSKSYGQSDWDEENSLSNTKWITINPAEQNLDKK